MGQFDIEELETICSHLLTVKRCISYQRENIKSLYPLIYENDRYYIFDCKDCNNLKNIKYYHNQTKENLSLITSC
jgi:hypothetical protein